MILVSIEDADDGEQTLKIRIVGDNNNQAKDSDEETDNTKQIVEPPHLPSAPFEYE